MIFITYFIGLKINQMSKEYAELLDNSNTKLVFKHTNR
jgi:hypothetical protein